MTANTNTICKTKTEQHTHNSTAVCSCYLKEPVKLTLGARLPYVASAWKTTLFRLLFTGHEA